MKQFLYLILFIFAGHAMADERGDLLKSWENLQKTSAALEYFKKSQDGTYKVKFKIIPYEGLLTVLAYDVEDIAYGSVDTKYRKMGYVEVELSKTDESFMNKYGRIYYKWAQSNTLYLNAETGAWDSSKAYSDSLMTEANKSMPGSFTLFFFEYWNYLLAIIILYFLISQIINSKRVKASMALQNKAVEESRAFMQLAVETSKKANEILENILSEIKKRP
ncbi:MAG: hypothetical protein FP816_08450 [Desulfobacteraceae bacterium]|nr:hypothetical protein [Desulfobacteraceae bacterium]MBU4001534.1 hypothetical protein [Pseudomonadota bacterium]MBU4054082.1 hypothetical protein [Pseudomonadota bacterium]